MLKTILEASRNFCIHQLGAENTVEDNLTKDRTLIAYIDIDIQSGEKFRVFIAPDSNFAQRVSTLFLEEDESDEDTLIDMTLETANMIVGSAKVIAEETNEKPFTISTPHFEKGDVFDCAYDEAKLIKIENDSLIIATKEIR